jgi:hypothetical protein
LNGFIEAEISTKDGMWKIFLIMDWTVETLFVTDGIFAEWSCNGLDCGYTYFL